MVSNSGCGLELGRDASIEDIARAVRRLLEEPRFTVAALDMRARFEREHDPEKAVNELETIADPVPV